MATIAPRPASALRARLPSRTQLAVPAGLAALVLLALVLRTRELGIGFWIDEGLSVGISDRPLGDIPEALRLDGSPPLYYMLLHVWMGVAGSSEEAVRWLSVACMLLAVPVAFWAAAGLFGTRAGWMAAVLVATNPFLTQFAQEGAHVRAGRPAGAGGLGGLRARLRAREPRVGRRLRRGAGDDALHAQLGAVLRRRVRPRLAVPAVALAEERRQTLILGAIAFGGALALYLPWIPTTLYQAAHTGAPWSESPNVVDLLGTPVTMLGQFA